MAAHRCDILVYRLYQGDATSQHTFELARICATMGFQPTISSNFPLGNLPDDIRAISRQNAYAAHRSQADLTILQYPLWFPLAERFRVLNGARIFWYHGVTPPEFWPVPEERDLLETSRVRTELANYAHVAAAASPFTATELQRYSSCPADRIRIAPLGIDTAAFAASPPDETLAALRDRWRLHDRRVLLYVGRIAGNKRIDILIDALALLKPTRDNLHLLIVGDDRDGVATRMLAAELHRHAETRGVADSVIFTGRVPDVKPYYHLANVFVHASQHEGFGAPLVEAMAAGVPVVASASGAMPWLLDADSANREAAGLTFQPGNAEDLAERVAEVLDSPGLYERLSARGRRRAETFNLQVFRVRAALIIAEAINMAATGAHVPEASMPRSDLYRAADTVLRSYTVASRIPLVGKYITQARTAATYHLKEAYFDRVMERQVSFNRMLAEDISAMEQQIARLDSQRTNSEVPL